MAPISNPIPSTAGRWRKCFFTPSIVFAGAASSCCIGGGLLRRRPRPSGQSGFDQGDGLGHSIESDKASESRSFLLAQQHLIEAAEPSAQIRKLVALADLVHDILDRLGTGAGV